MAEEIVELAFEGVDKFAEKYHDPLHDKAMAAYQRRKSKAKKDGTDPGPPPQGGNRRAQSEPRDDRNGDDDGRSEYDVGPRRRGGRDRDDDRGGRRDRDDDNRESKFERKDRDYHRSLDRAYVAAGGGAAAGYAGEEYNSTPRTPYPAAPYGYGAAPPFAPIPTSPAQAMYAPVYNGASPDKADTPNRRRSQSQSYPDRDRGGDRDGSPPSRRRRRRSSRARSRSRSKSPNARGLASVVVGALAGGLAGNELNRGDTFTALAGAVIGAVGAHKAEKEWEKRKEKREDREERSDRDGGDGKRRSGAYGAYR